MGKIKKLTQKTAMIAATILCIGSVVSAQTLIPAESIDHDESASLTVVFKVDDEEISGAEINLYKVADVVESGGGVSYSSLIGNVDYEGMTASESNDIAEELAEDEDIDDYLVQTGTTGSDGSVTFTGLEFGMYLVTQGDEYFNSSGDEYIFDPYLVAVPLAEESGGVYVWNYSVESIPKAVNKIEAETASSSSTETSAQYGALAIIKVDSETGEYLEGATFALYAYDGTYLNSYTTNEEGWLSTYPVSYGTYYFVETQAPDGYELDSDPIYVTVTQEKSYSPSYPWVIKVPNTKTTTTSETSKTTIIDTIQNIIANYKTGDASNVILWVVVLTAGAAVIIGVIIYKKKKKA